MYHDFKYPYSIFYRPKKSRCACRVEMLRISFMRTVYHKIIYLHIKSKCGIMSFMKTFIRIILYISIIIINTQAVLAGNLSLTVDQAAARAVNRSRELRTLGEDAYLAQLNRDFLQNRLGVQNFNTVTEFITHQADIMAENARRAAYLRNANAQRDTIHFLVANHFANILVAEGELYLYDARLSIMTQEQAMLAIKVEVGAASLLEYQMATLALETALHNRQALVNSINQAHLELNRLMGAPSDRIHQLIFEIAYEPLVVINFNGHINHQRQNHALVLEAQANADIHRFRLSNHRIEIDPQTGYPLPGQLSRDELIIFVNQAARNVIDTRLTVETHITETYHQIRQLEQDINTINLRLQDLYNHGEILQTRLAIGEIIPLEIARHNLDVLTLHENMRRIKANHHLLVMQFRNPNIALIHH